MQEAGCGCPVAPSFSSFSTVTVPWASAAAPTPMETTYGELEMYRENKNKVLYYLSHTQSL